MKKKKPELNFSPQANMLHLLKSAKSVALSSPKRNTVLLQPSILDVMTGKGTRLHIRTGQQLWMLLGIHPEEILSFLCNK